MLVLLLLLLLLLELVLLLLLLLPFVVAAVAAAAVVVVDLCAVDALSLLLSSYYLLCLAVHISWFVAGVARCDSN